jgi:TRAP-type mannitol/chloroaromatic compound transport system permease small subunit
MRSVLAVAHGVARAGVWLGGTLILLAAVLIGVDVVLRRFFAASLGTSWSLAAALLDRAHIRIDSFYMLLPGWPRAALDLFGLVLFVGLFALVGWHGIGVLQQSWASGSRSQSALETPLILPQALWLAGLGVFVAIGLALFLVAAGRLFAGDRAEAGRLVGTRSAQEEVEEEMRAAEARKSAAGGT